jgi:hypothetical protein
MEMMLTMKMKAETMTEMKNTMTEMKDTMVMTMMIRN